MKSTLAKELGLESNVKALQKRGDVFGIGQALVNQIDGVLDGYEDRIADWAQDTYNDMIGSSPELTGNLKESLDMNIGDGYPSRTFVGVDVTKMTAKAGQPYPSKNINHGVYASKEYTERADKWAQDRPDISSAPKGEFINAIWFEQAKKHANQRFGKLKYFRKI